MKLLKAMKNACITATRIAAALVVACCLGGTLKICLCDPDPDNCGEHCHDCTPQSSELCEHVEISIDASTIPSTDVPIPVVYDAPPPTATLRLLTDNTPLSRLRPPSTAPPDCGGNNYIYHSFRLYPLS